jgi:hypothetical protein
VTEGRLGGHEPFGEERMVAALEMATLPVSGQLRRCDVVVTPSWSTTTTNYGDDFTMVLLEFRSSDLGDGDRFEGRD